MNEKDNEIILSTLAEQTEPVGRQELQILSGILETEDFNNAISYLELKGQLVIVNRKKVALPNVAGYVAATIVRLSRGFCFAQPEDGSMDDIFIHASSSKGAMPGDKVLVRNIVMREKGPDGEVFKILEKGSRIITGIVEREKGKAGKAYVMPDHHFSYHLRIVQGGELKSKNGDKVKAAVNYDPKDKKIYARVIKIYGRADSAKICADAIIDANGIPNKFSVAIKHEAALASARPITEEEIAKRLDLRDEPIFTIDGADAKDLDDAVSVKKLDNGWELGVHIADVSHYVTEGSRLDEEAMERGTSVYFADRVIPMLPVEISNGCCSLNPDVKKLTFSAIMKLDENAELVDYRFEKSVIISKVRGVYSEVNRILDGTASDDLKEKYAPVYSSVFEAQKLASLLKAKAKQRGELEIESTELRFVLDENGVCTDVSTRERGEAEELIEQFMITANRAAALYAKSAGIPFVYRIHEAPEQERLDTLAELAAACGFETRRLKSGVRQTDLAALINKAKETQYARLISTQVLRTMAKARYSPFPLGHFGLSLADYCHFTSPIRRYPDTSIHRILTALVSGEPVDQINTRFADFANRSALMSSQRELRAMRAERETEKCYAAEYMRDHLGEIHDAVVSGVTAKGIYAVIENGIEGFINLTEDSTSFFEFNGTTSTTDKKSGKTYTIGDSLKIQVAAASVAMGTIDFLAVE
ncbi:MAG: ribonuclease R [Clostridia bacterium]|nr:ribonuclease R [Clostridia bacterium]